VPALQITGDVAMDEMKVVGQRRGPPWRHRNRCR
jgi:hypothetical protein